MNAHGSQNAFLLLSASYGAGHKRAAEAVAMALSEWRPDILVKHHDFYDFVSPWFNRLVQQTYVASVRYVPNVWGLFYTSTESISADSFLQRQINSVGARALEEFLHTVVYQAVVNTFPTPAGALSNLRRTRGVDVPNAVVVTDHAVHSQWIHPGIDRYYVGADKVAEGLADRGIHPDKIVATGIPIHPRFNRSYDKDAVRQKLGLGAQTVVLLMAGAYGMIGRFSEVVARLLETPGSIQYVVICGHDDRLRSRMLRLQKRVGKARLVVVGFTEDMPEYMAAADFLVSKAGGLTTSEAMAMGLPMILYRPIPGQEMANVALITESGAAVWVKDEAELLSCVERWSERKEERDCRAQAARALGKPAAAQEVAKDLVRHFL